MDLVHQVLVPSFHQTAVGSSSIARLLIETLQSTTKPIQPRAVECLAAASKLSLHIPPPLTSSSKPIHLLVPLFRYVLNQGINQKWTLVALSTIIHAIPVEDIPNDLLEKLLGSMEVTENIPIRSTLVVEILKSRWANQNRLHQGTVKEFYQTVYEPLLPLFDPSSSSPQTWQNVQRYLYPILGSIQSPSGKGFLQYLEQLPADGPLGQEAVFECWVTIASAAVSARTLGIREIDEGRLHQAMVHSNADVRLKAFLICSQNEDLFHQKGIAGLKAGYKYNDSLPGTG